MEKRVWAVIKGLIGSMGFFVGSLILGHLIEIELSMALSPAILGALVFFEGWLGISVVDSTLRPRSYAIPIIQLVGAWILVVTSFLIKPYVRIVLRKVFDNFILQAARLPSSS